ncbi:MAG: exo-alpha-sialidase, partial [Bacteroidia bacterium]|nr:exo-alpha-sialidase [Bacteroidia bacterium]
MIPAFTAGCMNQSDNSELLNKKYVLKLEAGNNNPRNSEGDFITLRDGRILFVYSHYTGNSADDHASAYLAGRYSSDGGETWTPEDVTIVEQEGLMNVMSVSMLRLQTGEIALFYLRKNSDSDCIPMLRISKDETLTWSDPVKCITDRDGYFVLNNSRVVQLKDGRLMMPVSLHKSPGDSTFASIGRIWNYYSDDNGKSWKASQELSNPGSVVTQEPGVVELSNGDIMMYLRTMSGVQYFSYSKDKGETWSPAESGNIKSPCSPASITRIPSTGDLLL